MYGVTCEDLPEPHVFTLSKNTRSVRVVNSELPRLTLIHLIQQINGCSALRVLQLSHTNLRGCLSGFLPDPHPGLPELEKLTLKRTELNKDDLQHLLSVAYKLQKLHELDLSGYTLTGCLSSFLPDPHPGLPELMKLNLQSTVLNKEDLHHLSHITHSKKLPNLQILGLSNNTLTGRLSSFLPDPHPGLPELEEVILWCTALNKDDLHHLTHLIQTHKLPRLKVLDLEYNRLSEMEMDVEHLIKACVNHHQRELKLGLSGHQLSETFKEKWKQRCTFHFNSVNVPPQYSVTYLHNKKNSFQPKMKKKHIY